MTSRGEGLQSCPRSGWAVGHFVSNYGGGTEISNPLPVYWENPIEVWDLGETFAWLEELSGPENVPHVEWAL